MLILTIGSFDCLHVGHLELLRESKRLAGEEGRLVAGLNSDAFITAYKGHAPVQPYAHRAEMLAAVRWVDLVVPNVGDADAKPIIEAIRPDHLTIGDDWLDDGHDERRYFAQLGVTPEWMAARQLSVVYVPRTRGVSSSALREQVA
jgi:glycerol-3-phosphate cytidylyltransferase